MKIISPERFVASVIAALRLKENQDTLPYDSIEIDKYFYEIFNEVKSNISKKKYIFNFSFKPDRIHLDSRELREAISMHAKEGLVSIDNPSFRTLRLKLSEDQSKKILENFELGNLVQNAVKCRQTSLFESL